LIPKDRGFDQDSLAVVFSRLEATSEPGSLPEYEEGPPLEGQYCQAPDVFRQWLWPVYSQQKIVLRSEYNDWKDETYPASYDPGDIDNDPEVDLPELPTQYTCTTCHNIEHPYMQLDASDYLVSCDLIIARTNLGTPELSFSLRGLRGQFNHLPMWTMFDPWNGQSLRKFDLGSDNLRIYGPMNGAFDNYSFSEVENLMGISAAQKYNALVSPGQIGFAADADVTDMPAFPFVTNRILPNDPKYGGDLSTWFMSSSDDMEDQHDETIQKWIDYGFKKWVEAENAARGR
jgi:hypothetical protein